MSAYRVMEKVPDPAPPRRFVDELRRRTAEAILAPSRATDEYVEQIIQNCRRHADAGLERSGWHPSVGETKEAKLIYLAVISRRLKALGLKVHSDGDFDFWVGWPRPWYARLWRWVTRAK